MSSPLFQSLDLTTASFNAVLQFGPNTANAYSKCVASHSEAVSQHLSMFDFVLSFALIVRQDQIALLPRQLLQTFFQTRMSGIGFAIRRGSRDSNYRPLTFLNPFQKNV